MSTISESYQSHLRKEHKSRKWGASGHKYSGARVAEILRERPYIKTVLDFGAGKCTLEEFVKRNVSRPLEWINYDPGVAGIDVLPDGQFDCVVSTDVLEHVEPDRLEEVLRLLERKTRYILLSDIACYPTGHLFGEGPYKGQDMHLTLMEPFEWRNHFAWELSVLQEFLYEHREVRNKGRIKTRCFMIHERV